MEFFAKGKSEKMENVLTGEYDVIVVGAGHAGCEAALASARMGKRTLILFISIESIAMMACNPSIGGTGKGHLVREIDALGGEMGLNIDKTFIQSRMLNTAKGPAVRSLRAQADKNLYHIEMKRTLESQENLDLKKGEVVELLAEKGNAAGVILKSKETYGAKAVILATGTFLRGRVYRGNVVADSGPNGLAPSIELADRLRQRGLPMRRFKTGTPARALAQSLDYSSMTEQKGDEKIVPFSFLNDTLEKDQISCWLTYTNEKTHQVIRDNAHRSPLFSGQIKGTGPRYCLSIEDKTTRFPDRERHQTFIEPEGIDTDLVYIQGMSSSMPEDIQREFYHTIPGLEHLEIVHYAYAIEYDCIDPLYLKTSLESKQIPLLFCAGQFNGSSGYEEAAAQGLMAGINAVLKINGKKPFILDRSQAYIGVLIDDMVTKGTEEPYRIMTGRAEYRLVLRQDNADQRLTEKGYKLGLATQERYQRFLKKKQQVQKEKERLAKVILSPKQANPFLEEQGSSPVQNNISLLELLKRPQVTYEASGRIDPERQQMPDHAKTQLEVQIKYEGYINKQQQQIDRFKKLENKKLQENMDYQNIEGLRNEARQKLAQQKPESVGQASRIFGVSPADINVLLIHLEKQRRKTKQEENP